MDDLSKKGRDLFALVAVDVAAATVAAQGYRVADWLAAHPDEQAALESLAVGPRLRGDITAAEARARRIVELVLRLALEGLPEESGALLAALTRFDAGSGGNQRLVEIAAGLAKSDGTEVLWQSLVNRSLVRDLGEGVAVGGRYGMHRLMRAATWGVLPKEEQEGFSERYMRTMASAVEAYAGLLGSNGRMAHLAFNDESASLETLARKLVAEKDLPPGIASELGRFRAEYAVNANQFAIISWPLERARGLLESAYTHTAIDGPAQLHASLALSMGQVDLREANLSAARERYLEALPLFRKIQDRLGEANALSHLGDLEAREDNLSAARVAYLEGLPIHR